MVSLPDSILGYLLLISAIDFSHSIQKSSCRSSGYLSFSANLCTCLGNLEKFCVFGLAIPELQEIKEYLSDIPIFREAMLSILVIWCQAKIFPWAFQGSCVSPEKDSKIFYWGNLNLRRVMFPISPELRLSSHVVYNFTFSPNCLFWSSWSSFFFLLWQVKCLSKCSSKDNEYAKIGTLEVQC